LPLKCGSLYAVLIQSIAQTSIQPAHQKKDLDKRIGLSQLRQSFVGRLDKRLRNFQRFSSLHVTKGSFLKRFTDTCIILLFLSPLQSDCFLFNQLICPRLGEDCTSIILSQQASGDETNSADKASRLIPQHVAFICDGNSRWARRLGLPAIVGHAAGADRFVNVVLPSVQKHRIKYCTLYGFSTENWKRSEREIREIFTIMEQTAKQMYNRLMKDNENIRIRVLGDLDDDRIPETLRDILYKLQAETNRLCGSSEQSLTLCLAINYGGRRDILNAARKLVEAASTGEVVDIDQFTEEDFSSLLCTDGLPDPDLIVRTSGEYRLSNFLLWNAAYSELYFTETLWPDFDHDSMKKALDWYSLRKRRFGSRESVLDS